MPQKCPCQNTNPVAQTVYPQQGGKVHPNFENQKKIRKKILSASTTTRKIRRIHWWNPLLNPSTIKGDICNFVVNISELALCLCDRRLWSFQYVATQRLQVSAFIGDVLLGRYFALGNTCVLSVGSTRYLTRHHDNSLHPHAHGYDIVNASNGCSLETTPLKSFACRAELMWKRAD